MEQALRTRPDEDYSTQPEPPHAREPGGIVDGIDKVLRFAMPPRHGDMDTKAAGPVTAREFAAAIDGVHEASQAIRDAEDRSREAEGRTQSVAQRASEELKHAEMRIQALESRVRAAEGRAQEAEARAKEADAWLRQIFATISEELPARRPAGQA